MERYLVDTNILVQIVTEQNFTEDVHYMLAYSGAQICVCSASVQELIHLLQSEDVKLQKQKIVTIANVFDFIENTLGFTVKYIDKGHLKQLCKMNIIDKHTDPFDRIIIAQSIAENIPLISSDKKFPKYRKMGLDFIPNY